MARYGKYMSLGKRIALVVVSVVVTLAVFFGIIYRADIKAFFGVMGNYSDKIKEEMEEEKEKQEQEEQENTDGETNTNTGFESGNDFMNVSSAGVALAYTNIAQEEFAAYGVAEEAESAMVMTAIISPSNATNVNLDWSVSFVNPDSEWATGKTVTDYVTITEQSETTAVLTNLLPFGEKIQMTVCVADNTAINAVATCDYVKKINNFANIFLDFAGYTDVCFLDMFRSETGVLVRNDLDPFQPFSVNPIYNYSESYTIDDEFIFTFEVAINGTTYKHINDTLGADSPFLPKSPNTFYPVIYLFNFFASTLNADVTLWEDDEQVALFIEAMQELGTNVEIGTVRIMATGEYSTYLETYPLFLSEECVTIPVTAVTLDNVNVQF